jgi:hypothetical protein
MAGWTALLDDAGHEVQAFLHGRRKRLEFSAPIRLDDCVFAQALPACKMRIERMRHGLDAGGVDRLQLFDETEQSVQTCGGLDGFGIAHFNARETGNAADLLEVQGHVAMRNAL